MAAAPAPKAVTYVAKDAVLYILVSIDEVTAVTKSASTAKLLDVRSRAEIDEGAIPGAVLLLETGYTNVKVYDGAWLEWKNQGMSYEEAMPEVAPTLQGAS